MLNLATISRTEFEYLNDGQGVPNYLGIAAWTLVPRVGDFLAGRDTAEHLARAHAHARFLVRADAVSYAVRRSYIAELRDAP